MTRPPITPPPLDPRLAQLPERLRAKFATNPPAWWTEATEGNK
jgi:hypothetical protein